MLVISHQCGRCDQIADFSLLVAFEHSQRTPEEVAAEADTSKRDKFTGIAELHQRKGKAQGSAIAHCPRCFGPSFFVFEVKAEHIPGVLEAANPKTASLFGGASLLKVTEVYPTPKVPKSDSAWPHELLDLFKDTQKMLDQNMSPAFVLSACRSVLELALKNLESPGRKGTLAARIERLRESGVITQGIAEWASHIRLDGNSAVHEGIGDADDAREYVAFLSLFFEVVFSLPKRIAERNAPGF